MSADEMPHESPEQMRQREWAEVSALPWDAPDAAVETQLPMVGRERAWRDRQLGRNIASMSTARQLSAASALLVYLVLFVGTLTAGYIGLALLVAIAGVIALAILFRVR